MIVANFTPAPGDTDDIALFLLDRPFTLGENSNVFPACLLDRETKQFDSLIFAGYGRTRGYISYDRNNYKKSFRDIKDRIGNSDDGDLMDDPDDSKLESFLKKLSDKPKWTVTKQQVDCPGVKICAKSSNASM